MATKVQKRSDRRKSEMGDIDIEIKKKNDKYEDSVKSLKEGAWKWGLFAICMVLLWFIFKFQ